MIPDIDKRALHRLCKQAIDLRILGNPPDVEHGLCVYWSILAYQALHKYGIKCELHAGSLYWPILKEDDGVSDSHFAYVWSPTERASVESMMNGGFAEVHVWLFIPESKEVVDFATGSLKRCAELMGHKWQTDEPPEFLWSATFPPGVSYVHSSTATQYALNSVKQVIRSIPQL